MHKKHGASRIFKGIHPDSPIVMLAVMLVIAVGVVGIAFISSRIPVKRSTLAGQVPVVTAAHDEAAFASSTAVLLLINQDSATLMRMDGTQQRTPLTTLDALFGTKPRPTEGSSAANGSSVIYPDPALAKGDIPSPDWAFVAHLADPRADGATAILLKAKTGEARTVVLREGNRPLRDGALAGWFDAKTMAVVAYTETVKALYAAGLDGSLRQVSALPDTVVMSSMRTGAFWYITAVQGPGIETPPQAPSELHRILSDGKDVLMAREEKRVITGILADGKGRVAYNTEDGLSELIGIDLPQGHVSLGKLRPVAILPNGRVAVRDGYDISAFDPATGASVRLGDLPEGDVRVFVADMPLDALAR